MSDGDVFAVSYTRRDFTSKREASRHATLSKDSLKGWYEQNLSDRDARQKLFNSRFSEVFGHTGDPDFQRFLQEALSNTLGSIGHSIGSLKVNVTSFGATATRDGPVGELLASYPSRSRYARGFLWDEGFHLTLIC